jgi:hypothetical protein
MLTAVVLMRDSRPRCKHSKKKSTCPSDENEIEFPQWWTGAVPTYLGPDGRTEPDLRKHIFRLLRIATEFYTNFDRPASYTDNRKHKHLFAIITPMLALYTWRDGVAFLSQEIDYFWERAVIGPNVEDFAHLKISRKYAENLYPHLKSWLAEVEVLLDPQLFREDDRLINEARDLLEQSFNLKQETTDTFQLLIGAIAIRDSEVQKQLARESRIQARRSTALTALAAIYLPLSLTTGIFGMNVSEINQAQPKYWAVLALGFGLLAGTFPFLLWIFFDKDDEDKKREESPAPGRRRDNQASGPSVTANGDLRESDGLRITQTDAGILRRRTTMSSRMSGVATGELRPSTLVRPGDIV